MSDPLHNASCRSTTAWTTVNASEALPGVSTPLTWTFYNEPTERAFRAAFCDLGVVPRSRVHVAPEIDDRLWANFYGRAAANLNEFRAMADLMPGTSADALEEQLFGQVRPDVTSNPSYRRWPVVAVKMPGAAMRVPGQLRAIRAETETWWRQVTAPGAIDGVRGARLVFREAANRFERIMKPHTLSAMLCQSVYEQVTKLAEQAGSPGLEKALITGYGSMDETGTVTDLWDVSRSRSDLDAFVSRHGFHGPAEGEMASRSWREDRAPLEALVQTYRTMDDDADPAVVARRQEAERRASEHALLATLGAGRRPGGRVVLALAARYLPLRGTGKAAFLQAVDAARAAARVIGQEHERTGALKDSSDVFFLTAEEVLADAPPDDAADIVGTRRARWDEYQAFELPQLWEGMPTPIVIGSASKGEAARTVLTGLAVSPGVIEGRARVVLDPACAELHPGEVLVCAMTDPSWASLFLPAAAVVIDVGGPLSHGAIVARELGIPCVINAGDATRVVRTGDLVRVDGSAGRIDIIETAAKGAPQ